MTNPTDTDEEVTATLEAPTADEEEAMRALLRRLGVDISQPPEIVSVRVERIDVPGEDQAEVQRRAKELAPSIARYGLLSEPWVIAIGEGASPWSYRAIDGRSRVIAHRLLALELVPVKVYKPSTSAGYQAILTLTANLRRSPSWVRELQQLDQLREALREQGQGATDREIAQLLCIPIGTVRRYLRFLELPASLLRQVYRGRLSEALAYRVLACSAPQRTHLAEIAVLRDITEEDIRDALYAGRAATLSAPLFAPEPPLPTTPRAEMPPRTRANGIAHSWDTWEVPSASKNADLGPGAVAIGRGTVSQWSAPDGLVEGAQLILTPQAAVELLPMGADAAAMKLEHGIEAMAEVLGQRADATSHRLGELIGMLTHELAEWKRREGLR